MTPRASTLLASLPELTQKALAARGLTAENVLDLTCERWGTNTGPEWVQGWTLNRTIRDGDHYFTATVTWDSGKESDSFTGATSLEAALEALDEFEDRLAGMYEDYECKVPA